MKNLLSLPALFLALSFNTTAQTDQPARRDGQPQPPLVMAMRTFRTLSVSSKTALVGDDTLVGALQRHKEIDAWGLSFTTGNTADVLLEVDHTPLTFIYHYKLTQRSTGVVLAAGKLHALAIEAPSDIATQIVRRIAQYRQVVDAASATIPPKDPPPATVVRVPLCEMQKCPAPR